MLKVVLAETGREALPHMAVRGGQVPAADRTRPGRV